jgi:hypothetical protein
VIGAPLDIAGDVITSKGALRKEGEMPNGKNAYEIDFTPLDLSKRLLKPGDEIIWHSRQKWRRKNGACKGIFVGKDSDGWLRVKYIFGSPGAYKTRTVRIEPLYVIGVKQCSTPLPLRKSVAELLASEERLLRALGRLS